MYEIEIIKGNIMNTTGDTVVCSADNDLTPGCGHNRSLFYAAGSELVKECEEIGFCDTGKVARTHGYNLPFKYVIHAVGPYWHGGTDGEAENLSSCYREIMIAAKELHSETVVIPAICTGRGNYPIQEAAEIAMYTVKHFLSENKDYSPVIKFMCYNAETLLAYRQTNINSKLNIDKYFNRKKVVFSVKMDQEEKNYAKFKPFRRSLTKEQKRELSKEILKYSLKENFEGADFLSDIKKEKINEEICRKYGKAGPFVTLDSIDDATVSNGYIKFTITPFVYRDENIKGEIDNHLFYAKPKIVNENNEIDYSDIEKIVNTEENK